MKIQRLRPIGERWGVRARPMNCAADLGEKERCPYCNQFHLRSGYCQALDEANADRYPHLHQSHASLNEAESHKNETETEFETGAPHPWIAEGVSRATYFRRRAAAKEQP